MKIHIIHHNKMVDELKLISDELFLIIKNQHKMSNQLDGIAADLQAANEKADKIAADVKNLDSQIASLGDAPTSDEIAAVKAQSAALVDKLSGIDELTPDAPADGGNTGDTTTGGDTTTADGSGDTPTEPAS